jgi:hypothetical protein
MGIIKFTPYVARRIVQQFIADVDDERRIRPMLSAWYEANGVKAYLRLGRYNDPDGNPRYALVLANIGVPEILRSQGLFTDVVDYMIEFAAMRKYGFMVENALNPKVLNFVTRRGYVPSTNAPSTFWHPAFRELGPCPWVASSKR